MVWVIGTGIWVAVETGIFPQLQLDYKYCIDIWVASPVLFYYWRAVRSRIALGFLDCVRTLKRVAMGRRAARLA